MRSMRGASARYDGPRGPGKEKYGIYLRCLENEKAALLQLRSPDALPRRGPSLMPSGLYQNGSLYSLKYRKSQL
jgi:hypothetical protein